MLKKPLFLVVVLLLTSLAFAQDQTFTLRQGVTPFVLATSSNGGLDRNYPNPNFYASERFVIRYFEDRAHDAHISAATGQDRLRSLENAYDSIVTRWNFYPPFHVNRDNPATFNVPLVNTRYKSEVIVTRGRNNTSGTTAWADGGGTAYGGLVGTWNNGGATSTERPIQWIPSGLSATTLTHELVHGLQQMAGGMRDSDFVGWFHECHAQFMTSHVHGGTSGGLGAARVTKRQGHLHPGYARSRYENWPWLEYILHFEQTGTHSTTAGRRDRLRERRQDGMNFINNIWTRSPNRNSNLRQAADPFTEAASVNGMSWADFGDVMGMYAMRSVTFDYGPRRATFRTNWNNVADTERHQRYTYLQALNGSTIFPAGQQDWAAANNRYVSPHSYAPQRLAFNIIRLYPDGGGNWSAGSTVTVNFRGVVQTANNVSNYAPRSGYTLEGAANRVDNNPGSAWRYGLVAVSGDAAATANTAAARYSDLMRTNTSTSGGNIVGVGPDVSMTLQSGETQLYLVVTAAPTAPHKLRWDQYHYTSYRFPYMVQINGAKPEGFQGTPGITWRTHSNGGGQIASTVATIPATVFIAPNARVFGGTLSGNARIEGRAVVRGGTVRGNAIIRDHAVVRSGTVEGDAIVSDGATIWGATVNQDARVYGSALLTGGTVTGNAEVGGAAVISGGTISGTARALGDAFGSLTQSRGVWYAAGSGASGDPQGANRTVEMIREFTAPFTTTNRAWYGPSGTTSLADITPVVTKNVAKFNFDKYGVLRYDLAGAPSANLRIFDARGRVVNTITLSGAQNMVNTNLNLASQMLLWKVDVNGKIIDQGRVSIKR